MLVKPIYNWLVASRTTKRGDCEPNPKTPLKLPEVLVQGGLMKLNLLSVVGLFEKNNEINFDGVAFFRRICRNIFQLLRKKMSVAVVLR